MLNGSAEAEQRSADDSTGKSQLVKTVVVDEVSASIFARQHQGKDGKHTFYNVSFSRSYLDKAGKRRYIKTFDLADLVKVGTVATEAEAYIRGRIKGEVEK